MGKLTGSRRLPSSRGERTNCTRQLSWLRLRISFAAGNRQGGRNDLAQGLAVCGDGSRSPDDSGRRAPRVRPHLLLYLPGALSVLPLRRGAITILKVSACQRDGASVIERNGPGQCRTRTGVGLRCDRGHQPTAGIVGLSEPAAPRAVPLRRARGAARVRSCRITGCSAGVHSNCEKRALPSATHHSRPIVDVARGLAPWGYWPSPSRCQQSWATPHRDWRRARRASVRAGPPPHPAWAAT